MKMPSWESTVLITGGTSGLGYYTALHLGKAVPSAKIVIASRTDRANAETSLNNELLKFHRRSEDAEKQVEFVQIDLMSLTKIRAFVTELHRRTYPAISILCLNAGIQYQQGKELRYTDDGIEATFGTNHVGHALLFHLLQTSLKPDARILVVASGTHDPAQKTMVPDAVYDSAEALAHPTDGQGYESMKGPQRYASSKLANVLWAYALETHLKTKRATDSSCQWTVCSFDPGLMPGTSLIRDLPKVALFIVEHIVLRLPFVNWLLKKMTRSENVHSPSESGANLASRALHQDVTTSGEYVEGPKARNSSVESYKTAKQDDLWSWTLEFISQNEKEKQAFANLESS